MEYITTIKGIIDSYVSHNGLQKRCLISTNPKQISSDKIVLTVKNAIDNPDISVHTYSIYFSKDDPSNIDIINGLYFAIQDFIDATKREKPGISSLSSIDIKELEINFSIIEEKLVSKSGIFCRDFPVMPYSPNLKYSLEAITLSRNRLLSGEINLSEKRNLKFKLTIKMNEYTPDVSEFINEELTVKLPARFCTNQRIADANERWLNLTSLRDQKDFRSYTLELQMLTSGFLYEGDSLNAECKWVLEEI